MDWDLWPLLIEHGRRVAAWTEMSAALSEVTAEFDRAIARVAEALTTPLEDIVAAFMALTKEL